MPQHDEHPSASPPGACPATRPDSRRRRFTGACAALAALAAARAGAQGERDWKPAQPIRILVPFAPGGGTDSAARLLAEGLGRELGQNVVVENVPGATGLVATRSTYSAPPNGYVLMMGTSATHSTNPHLFPAAAREVPAMAAVASVATVPVMLVGRKSLPYDTAVALLEHARRQEMTYAHYGTGSAGQLAMEMIRRTAGIDRMIGVPYKGGGPALQAVLAGEVDLSVVPVNSALAQSERLRLYGTVSARRPAGVEHVPTLREQGCDVAADAWVGLFAPPGTPARIVDALSRAVRALVADAEFKRKLQPLGLAPLDAGGPADFSRFVVRESDRYAEVIRSANIKADN